MLHTLVLAVAFLSSVPSIVTQTATAPGTLKFTAPKTWTARPSSSAMRVGEFVLPGSAGEAELVVYYFGGGGGGGVEANIERWTSQMQQPEGRSTTDGARRQTKTINGLQVTLLDLTGTYIAEVRPGATERHNSPGFRMRTAVIETPRGPYYIKLVGPATTVEARSAEVDAFLSSLQFEK